MNPAKFLLLPILISSAYGQCRQCHNYFQRVPVFRFQSFPRNGNINIARDFQSRNSFNPMPYYSPANSQNQFSPYVQQQPRVLNVYGQDASEFGSAIGKSIAQRIQQVYNQQQQTPSTFSSYNIQFSPPASSATSEMTSAFPTSEPSSPASSAPPSTNPTSIATSPAMSSSTNPATPSTHPPENLPTVQQAFSSLPSTPSYIPIGYGSSSGTIPNINHGYPGLLPPPSSAQIGYDPIRRMDLPMSNCPYCEGGFRMKKKREEVDLKEEKKKDQ